MRLAWSFLIAQPSQPADSDSRLWWMSVTLAGVGIAFLAAAIAMWVFRKRMKAWEDQRAGLPFSFDELRHLNKTGQLSDEEFDRAKRRVIDATLGPDKRQPDTAPPASEPRPPADIERPDDASQEKNAQDDPST